MSKKYYRLPFEQYFIDASGGWGNNEDKILNKVDWKRVDFDKGRHDVHYCVMFDKTRKVIQIYFRDTTGIKQWISNLTFPKSYYDEFQYKGKDIKLKVARGWLKMYNAVKHYVREDFYKIWSKHKTAEIEIIGWSLGSALAQLCAQDLFFNYEIKAHVFTYGSVKPWFWHIWNQNAKYYLDQCCAEIYNFGDNNDIVVYMVPFLGYHKINKIKLKQHKFCITRLFNPKKYHTEYWKSELYKDIK